MDDLSAASERDEVIELIAYLLYNINYGNDLEQHLNTLVDARKSLPNFDPVTSLVVHDINKLVMQAHRITRGKHTAETLSFVKTAIAICHITIPSVLDPIERMHLFLCSAEVALINHLISQAEGLLKAAIKEIPSLPSDFEAARLCDWVQKFLSFSIMFPGHPVHGPFYLIKGLLNALEAFLPWVNNISKAKTRIYMDLVAVCCAYYQIKLPYGISGVDSNDVLFGGSQSYLKEVDDMLQRTFENIFDQIQLQSGAPELQSELCLLVANQITSHLTMNEYAADRVFRLIKLFLKNTESGNSTAAFQHTMENLCARNGTLYRLIYDRIKQIV